MKKIVAKTLIYRAVSMTITALVVFVITKRLDWSLVIGGTTTVIKTIWYYSFELLWKKWLKFRLFPNA